VLDEHPAVDTGNDHCVPDLMRSFPREVGILWVAAAVGANADYAIAEPRASVGHKEVLVRVATL
jgi:hypothetical protein